MTQEELKQRLIDLVKAATVEMALTNSDGKVVVRNTRRIVDYAEAINLVDHLIANGVTIRERGEWISVTERLPEDGGMYLVFNPKRAVAKVATVRYSLQSRRWCGVEALSYIEGITHWMPLPEPPERSDAE